MSNTQSLTNIDTGEHAIFRLLCNSRVSVRILHNGKVTGMHRMSLREARQLWIEMKGKGFSTPR